YFAKPNAWALYPETVSTLATLDAWGLALGIVSNFDSRLYEILIGLGIDRFFESVTISSVAGAAKPSPKIFQRALQKHGVTAGAVGGYFGARLVRAGVDCMFLLRPRTLAAVKQKGLTVHSVDESFTVHPAAGSDARALSKASLVILSVKRYDLDEVIEQLRPVHFANATVLTLQNGVDAETRILELVPNAQLVGGVAYIYARIAEPGVIEHYKRGSVAIGTWLQTAVPGSPQKEEPEIQSASAKGPF